MTPKASTAAVRQWAREQRIAVGDRGRISPEVFLAYEAAHGAAPVTANDVAVPREEPAHRGGPALRITVRPAAGATGAGRRVRARPS